MCRYFKAFVISNAMYRFWDGLAYRSKPEDMALEVIPKVIRLIALFSTLIDLKASLVDA